MVENYANWMSGPQNRPRIVYGPPHKSLLTPPIHTSMSTK